MSKEHSCEAVNNLHYHLTPSLMELIKQALQEQDITTIFDLIHLLEPADIADIFCQIESDDYALLIQALDTHFDPEILTHLDPPIQKKVLSLLGEKKLSQLLPHLESDDIIDLVEELEDDKRKEILQHFPVHDRIIIEQNLTYPDDSAGRIMQRELVTMPVHWTVGQVVDTLRLNQKLPNDFYDIFVLDEQQKLTGVLALARIMRSHRSVLIQDIMQVNFKSLPVTTDKEEVALLFKKYGLVSAPVITQGDYLVGVITVDDVVDIINEEAEEDILYLAGVSEQDTRNAVFTTTSRRLPWLIINLALAFLASWVVSLFKGTLDQYVALAVLMMIVPSLSGNAATQTMTVVIRSLAMREIFAGGIIQLLKKEALVGILNGIFFASLTGLIAGIWFVDIKLGLVIAGAMIFNLVIAAIVGVGIPYILSKTSIDPAIASSIFVTIFTDVLGFFAFLGLATLFLL